MMWSIVILIIISHHVKESMEKLVEVDLSILVWISLPTRPFTNLLISNAAEMPNPKQIKNIAPFQIN